MRAKEFTINIPINIKINSDGDPEISTGEEEPIDDNVGEYVPPLQKKIELMKKSQGVESVYDEEGEEQEQPPEIGTDAGPVDLGFDEDEPFDG